MAVLNLAITTGRSSATLARDFRRASASSSKYPAVNAIYNFISSILSGNETGSPSIAVSVQEDAVRASGTFILDTVIATDVVTINGVSFTAVASGATGNQFNVGANDNATAAALAAAINASVTALVSGYVTAAKTTSTLTPATVTVTSAFYGTAGNQTLIESADATIVASGARLTAGAADANAKTYSF